MIIRPIREDDAGAFLDLCRALDEETAFMMLEPGERPLDIDARRAAIAAILACDNATLFVADEGRNLAGYAEASGGTFRRNRHSAHLVIGVRRAFAGRGIGRRLLAAVDEWAPRAGVHRLELTVMIHNAAAVHLYRKCGFEIEGVRKHSLLVDAAWVDEYAMAKLV